MLNIVFQMFDLNDEGGNDIEANECEVKFIERSVGTSEEALNYKCFQELSFTF